MLFFASTSGKTPWKAPYGCLFKLLFGTLMQAKQAPGNESPEALARSLMAAFALGVIEL